MFRTNAVLRPMCKHNTGVAMTPGGRLIAQQGRAQVGVCSGAVAKRRQPWNYWDPTTKAEEPLKIATLTTL